VNNLETNLSEHDNYQSCINVISNINAIDNNYIMTNDNNLNDMNPDLSLNNLNSTCFDGNSLLIAHSTPARVFSDCSFVNKNRFSKDSGIILIVINCLLFNIIILMSHIQILTSNVFKKYLRNNI
jgi:hypothetical protein